MSGIEEQKVRRAETCRGAVWRSGHWGDSSQGIKATEIEVREIAEKGIVVILGQDGISGWEDEADDGDELVAQANQLLDLRWNNVKLMDEIVYSKEFGAGDYRGSLEAAFKRADEMAGKRVVQMNKKMGEDFLDWTDPIVWRALYNSVAVIITREEVIMAGAGSFNVSAISREEVNRISFLDHIGVSLIKADIASGIPYEGIPASNLTVADTFRKYELRGEDECITVERSTPKYRVGNGQWLRLGKEGWGAALTSLSTRDWGPKRYFEAVLLELERGPQSSMAGCTGGVPAQASPPSAIARPSKRQKAMQHPQPIATH